jgi:cell division protein FtsZ
VRRAPPLTRGTSEKSGQVSAATKPPVAPAKNAGGAEPADKPKQVEFGFQGDPVENRGAFEKSDRNLFEGQDLDLPTYLRKGIKIVV